MRQVGRISKKKKKITVRRRNCSQRSALVKKLGHGSKDKTSKTIQNHWKVKNLRIRRCSYNQCQPKKNKKNAKLLNNENTLEYIAPDHRQPRPTINMPEKASSVPLSQVES